MTKFTQTLQCPDTGIEILATFDTETGCMKVETVDDDETLIERMHCTRAEIDATESWCREVNICAAGFDSIAAASRWLAHNGAPDVGDWNKER